MIDLSGVFPPLPTSFDQSDALYAKGLKQNISKLNAFDLAGYLVLGSNGELVHLLPQEVQEVYEITRSEIPKDKLMLAGSGAQSTRQTLLYSKWAAQEGADAVLILNPSYYKGLMNLKALRQHYFEVADAIDIPVIIYNMPANSGMDMDAQTICSLAEHENIVGVKDSGGNLAKMAQIVANTDDSFQVLSGSAGFLLPALSVGAVGGILAYANIKPQDCIDLLGLYKKGSLEAASMLQQSMIELNTKVTRGWGVPALKAAMDILGYYGGPCRKPGQPLEEEKIEVLKTYLEKK